MPKRTTSLRHPGPQRIVEPYAATEMEFDLPAEIEQLHREPAWESGRNSKTLVKHEDFRIVLTALKPGASMADHHADGRISVQTLAGHVHMQLPDRVVDLPTGGMLALDTAVPHDVEALEPSAILITIAWPGDNPHCAPAGREQGGRAAETRRQGGQR